MLSRRRTVTLVLHLIIVVSLLLSSVPSTTVAQTAPISDLTPSVPMADPSTALRTSFELPAAVPASDVAQPALDVLQTFAGPSLIPTPEAKLTPTPTVEPEPATAAPMEKLGVVESGGGKVRAADGRVTVEFPSRAVRQSVEVSYRVRKTQALDLKQDKARVSRQLAPLFEFDLEAYTLPGADGKSQQVSQFNQPLTVTVSVKEWLDLENLPSDLRPFLAYKAPDGRWVEVPVIKINRKAGTITARVDHFTGWGQGITAANIWSLVYNPPHANLFGGSMTHQIDFQAPAGRNGLQPKLTLSYNSFRMNGRAGGDREAYPVPDGWSLDVMDIVRDKWFWCDWDEDDNGPCFQDVFSLLMNGTAYELYAGQDGRYYAKDAPELYIERRNDARGNGAPNWTGEYWIVRMPDGTEARFGYNTDAEQVTSGVCEYDHSGPFRHDCRGDYPQSGYRGRDNRAAARRWRVDQITDVYGNLVIFAYDDLADGDWHNAKNVLRHIYYNGELSQIDLVDADGGWPSIDRIDIQNTNNSGNKVRTRYYVLGRTTLYYRIPGRCHDDEPEDWYLPALTSVQEFNGDGSASLPGQTFSYGWFNSEDDGACYPAPRLTVAQNGYGARTDITYQDAGDRETSWSWRVQQVTTSGGAGGNPAMVSTYTYGTPCYDRLISTDGGYTWISGPCTSRATNLNRLFYPDLTPKGPLVGHDVVTQTSLGPSGETLAKSIHWFHTDVDWKLGREWKADQVDPASGAVLQRQETTWTQYGLGGVAYFVKPTESKTTDDPNGTPLVKRSTSAYDSYGNATEQIEYDASNNYYRRTLAGYYPITTTRWIVNKPGYQNVERRNGSVWAKEASTWYSYDGQPNCCYTISGTGTLTAVRRWHSTDIYGDIFVDTVYGYDTWGNRISEKTYDNYGRASVYAGQNPKTITTTFDSVYHLYPVQITNPKGQSTQAGYDLALGVPLTVTDANGASTYYAYDTFGRLKKIARPGDSLSYPTEEYRYYDGGDMLLTDRWPLMIDHLSRAKAGADWCATGAVASMERMFYDGLGRLVEQQSAGANWTCNGGGQDIVQYTSYGALGQVVTQSVPYTVSQWTWATTPEGRVVTPYKDPDVTQPRTTTQYDALGRAVRALNPDGTDATTMYSGWTSSQVDGNGHYKASFADAFGRLSRVDETVASLEDPFNSKDTTYWVYTDTYQTIDNRTLKNTGTGNWNATFYRNTYNITGGAQGQGVKVEFKVNGANTQTYLTLEAQGDPHPRLGIIAHAGKIYVQYSTDGSNWVYPADLINPLELNTWYVVTLKASRTNGAYIEGNCSRPLSEQVSYCLEKAEQ